MPTYMYQSKYYLVYRYISYVSYLVYINMLSQTPFTRYRIHLVTSHDIKFNSLIVLITTKHRKSCESKNNLKVTEIIIVTRRKSGTV